MEDKKKDELLPEIVVESSQLSTSMQTLERAYSFLKDPAACKALKDDLVEHIWRMKGDSFCDVQFIRMN